MSAADVATRQAGIAQAGAVAAAQVAQGMESSARALAVEVAQADAMVHVSSPSRVHDAAAPAREIMTPAQDAARLARENARWAQEAAVQARDAALLADGRVLPASVDMSRAASRLAGLREELKWADQILRCITEACHSAELSTESAAGHYGERAKTGSWTGVPMDVQGAIEEQVGLQAWRLSTEAGDPWQLIRVMQHLESATAAYIRACSEHQSSLDRPRNSNPPSRGGERKSTDALSHAYKEREKAVRDCIGQLSEADSYTPEARTAGLIRAWRQAVEQAAERKAQLTADMKLAEGNYDQAVQLLADCQHGMRHAEEVASKAEAAAQQARHQAEQAKQQARQISQAARETTEHHRRSRDAWQAVTRLACSWHALLRRSDSLQHSIELAK